MAKSTNNQRLYLDFNATSPLAPPVREYLAKGDFLFGNPASLHATGKKSKRAINEVRDYLYQTLDFKERDYHLFFHSGATEGINQIVKGMAFELTMRSQRLHFFCVKTDHSCVFEQKTYLESHSHFFTALDVDQQGQLDLAQASEEIKNAKGEVLINLTLSNNETGALLNAHVINHLKAQFPQALIHIDAVQAPGKVQDWTQQLQQVDAFTLSCHKFGSLKGVGLSFIKRSLPFHSLIEGGDQQDSLRAGTENPDGIWSVKLALEWIQIQDQQRLRKGRDQLEELIRAEFGTQVSFAAGASARNANTSYIIMEGVKADIMLTAFDLAGIDVSTGSACRSGSVSPSRVLLAMNYDEQAARSAVRLSLGHHLTDEELASVAPRVLTVLRRFKKE